MYNQFSFKLNDNGSQYKLWRKIFSNMCQVTLFYGYISRKSVPIGENDEEWFSVNAHIKSWLYRTFDLGLLQIISSDDFTAKDL